MFTLFKKTIIKKWLLIRRLDNATIRSAHPSDIIFQHSKFQVIQKL